MVHLLGKRFRHCGFYRAKCIREEIVDPSYDEFSILKSKFDLVVPKEENVVFENYVNLDQHLSTNTTLIEISDTNTINTDDINIDESNSNDVDDDCCDLTVKITLSQINSYVHQIKIYSLQRENKEYCNKLLKLVTEMENLLFSEPKVYQQTCLDYYFN